MIEAALRDELAPKVTWCLWTEICVCSSYMELAAGGVNEQRAQSFNHPLLPPFADNALCECADRVRAVVGYSCQRMCSEEFA